MTNVFAIIGGGISGVLTVLISYTNSLNNAQNIVTDFIINYAFRRKNAQISQNLYVIGLH